MKNNRAVVLWTGGKDCNLALYEAKLKGYNIVALISFSGKDTVFKAHPVDVMKAQTNALGICHALVEISEPYEEGYEKALLWVKHAYRIETIVTGDIAEIHGHSNWIADRSRHLGLNVFLPLWHLDREHLLSKLLSLHFKVVFSCVKRPWFEEDWLGIDLDQNALEKLRALRKSTGLDICGEQGEYHTLVLDGPLYRERIVITAFARRANELMAYMDVSSLENELKVTHSQ